MGTCPMKTIMKPSKHDKADAGVEQGRAEGDDWQDLEWEDDLLDVVAVGKDQRGARLITSAKSWNDDEAGEAG